MTPLKSIYYSKLIVVCSDIVLGMCTLLFEMLNVVGIQFMSNYLEPIPTYFVPHAKQVLSGIFCQLTVNIGRCRYAVRAYIRAFGARKEGHVGFTAFLSAHTNWSRPRDCKNSPDLKFQISRSVSLRSRFVGTFNKYPNALVVKYCNNIVKFMSSKAHLYGTKLWYGDGIVNAFNLGCVLAKMQTMSGLWGSVLRDSRRRGVVKIIKVYNGRRD